ncbi:hypothetical protein C8J56DRAFT_901030 [Mycena floridula]|nr:hypothetical protein C8J56DRAFT_901030 [Mycena floridula]
MTDCHVAQINACRHSYPESEILLCWWHILYAWQKHFRIVDHEFLWEILKKWICISDATEFETIKQQILDLAPADFADYLNTYWLVPEWQKMWSAVFRTGRSIYDNSDTNMLIEAWHHVLKGKFLNGKCNRRLDYLIYVFLEDVIPFYKLKQHRQDEGFEGLNLEMERHKFTDDDIELDDDDANAPIYYVQSKSVASVCYQVDLIAYSCECLDFPSVAWCKHICDVETFFGLGPPTPLLEPLSPTPHPTSPSTDADSDALVQEDNIPELSLSKKDQLLSNNMPNLLELVDNMKILSSQLHKISLVPKSEAHCLLPLESLRLLVAETLELTTDSTETARILPHAKTTKKKAAPNMDPSYGGGQSSGTKAKAESTAGVKHKRNSPLASQPTPPASQPLLLPQLSQPLPAVSRPPAQPNPPFPLSLPLTQPNPPMPLSHIAPTRPALTFERYVLPDHFKFTNYQLVMCRPGFDGFGLA